MFMNKGMLQKAYKVLTFKLTLSRLIFMLCIFEFIVLATQIGGEGTSFIAIIFLPCTIACYVTAIIEYTGGNMWQS